MSSLRPAMRFHYLTCAAALLLAAGCATLTSANPGEPEYAEGAPENLQLGDTALEDKDYERARKYYEHVRSRFPYALEATEAELRLADTDFAQEHYPEAREKYDSFIRLHPTSPRVDYAAYRAALSYVQEIPSDFFMLPPVAEKDQTAAQSAQRALEGFLRQYSTSPLAKEAQKKLEEVRRRLAEHELYVAAFYRRRERWKAVAQRLEGMLERYPGTSYEEQALFSLHEAYVQLKDTERAREALQRVISRLPGTPAAERARRMLGS